MSKNSVDTRAGQNGSAAHPVAVPGAPSWVTPSLIARTMETWQPFYKTRLTPEEALAMILSVSRLFDVLSRSPQL